MDDLRPIYSLISKRAAEEFGVDPKEMESGVNGKRDLFLARSALLLAFRRRTGTSYSDIAKLKGRAISGVHLAMMRAEAEEGRNPELRNFVERLRMAALEIAAREAAE